MLLGKYDNRKIQGNFLVVKVLSAISLAFSVLVGIANCFDLFSLNQITSSLNLDLWGKILTLCFFYIYLITIPLVTLLGTLKSDNYFTKQTANNNDMANLITTVCLSFVPWWFLISRLCFGIPWSYFGEPFPFYENTMLVASTCGMFLLAHFFIYIADGFLLYNLVLIKRTWLLNPPVFIIEQKLKEKKKADETQQKISAAKGRQHEINAEAVYAQNIEVCGIRFFIKYYRAITLLPLPDIEVEENYSSAERSERLLAAKRIIAAGASEYAFRKILSSYSDILLSASEIEQIQSILNELEKSKPTNDPKSSAGSTIQLTEITYLQEPIKYLMLLHTTLLCLAWIPAIWTIPMTVYYIICIKKHRRVGYFFGILTLLFLNSIVGALILCDAAKMPSRSSENTEEK